MALLIWNCGDVDSLSTCDPRPEISALSEFVCVVLWSSWQCNILYLSVRSFSIHRVRTFLWFVKIIDTMWFGWWKWKLTVTPTQTFWLIFHFLSHDNFYPWSSIFVQNNTKTAALIITKFYEGVKMKVISGWLPFGISNIKIESRWWTSTVDTRLLPTWCPISHKGFHLASKPHTC